MKIASSKVIEEIEKMAKEELLIPSILLMENAALKVISNIDDEDSYFVVICGKGNNGGDGLAIARHLAVMGKDVDVYFLSSDDKGTENTETYLKILRRMNVNVVLLHEEADLWDLREAVDDADCVIDAIFGMGINRKITGINEEVIEIINELSKKTISVDLPSGINGDSGEIQGICVKADKTISFNAYKKGFLNYNAIDYCGDIIIENIGIPENVIRKSSGNEYILNLELIKRLMPKRRKTGYKGDYGKVLVVAGSPGFTGANKITSEACIATGAGLVTVSSDERVIKLISENVREAMTVYPSDIERVVSSSNVIAFGPGMGNTPDTLLLLMRIIKRLREDGKVDSVLILDADGINVLSDKSELIENIGCNVIMTPHFGEMAKLTGHTVEYIKKNRLEVAKKFAKKNKVVLVLKGHNTIITDGTYTYLNPTGSSAIASGGMGDCLTGIIAGLSGQGLKPIEAALIGTYIHGYVGDELAKDRYSVTATQIINRLPFELKNLVEGKI